MTEEIIKMNCYKKGYNVWIEDKESAWVTAQVVDVNGKQIHVKTSNGKKVMVSSDKLYPRDPDADHGGVDDMTKLTYLNEPGVLYNLARRYALNDIYTYTGSILIAVNPFTKLPHLYNAHMMEQYKGASFGELSPHVFAVADASYRAMMNEARSQSILVSGESGAGKTETTKLIMQYLTFVGGRAAGDDRTVEQQVLEVDASRIRFWRHLAMQGLSEMTTQVVSENLLRFSSMQMVGYLGLQSEPTFWNGRVWCR